MGNVLAEVVLQHRSGIIADSVVNTFAFSTATPVPTVAEMDEIGGALASFYNTIPAAHNAIAGFIGSQISRAANAASMRFYDLSGHMDGSAHGSPIYTVTWTLGAMVPGATSCPSELAAALSFRAAYFTFPEFAPNARPRSSLRGRVYIGPLTTSSFEQDGVTGRVRVAQGLRETLTTQGAALRDNAATDWSVWSRKLAQFRTIELVWADDAFDVQRRRGEKAIVRTAA